MNDFVLLRIFNKVQWRALFFPPDELLINLYHGTIQYSLTHIVLLYISDIYTFKKKSFEWSCIFQHVLQILIERQYSIFITLSRIYWKFLILALFLFELFFDKFQSETTQVDTCCPLDFVQLGKIDQFLSKAQRVLTIFYFPTCLEHSDQETIWLDPCCPYIDDIQISINIFKYFC